jgi:flagellar motor protein MotB
VSPTRVETEGRGSREPVADNGSDAGRAQNRRVEIMLREPAPAS